MDTVWSVGRNRKRRQNWESERGVESRGKLCGRECSSEEAGRGMRLRKKMLQLLPRINAAM
jgi:hypothetical protein